MSDKVKVWNDNKYPFRQKFKGELIEVPAGKYIEMPYTEAIEFKSAYYPPILNNAGIPQPESYKMIRVEGKPDDSSKPKEYICMHCKDRFFSQDELDSHIDKNHLDDLTDQDEAKKRRGRQKHPEI